MTSHREHERRTDRASIVINSPPGPIFEAMTKPDALVDWLPPDEMTGEMIHADIRPGGSYRMVLAYNDTAVTGKHGDGTDVIDVRIIDIETPHRLVQAIDFDAEDPAFSGTMSMTWQLSAHPDGTRVDIAATDVPSGIVAADHEQALTSTLSKLSTHLGATAHRA